ncbi:phytoene desaturase [Demequina sp. TTPB684]|uniref:phytoene desaturase family protein n=1 Tax=unclassified Demequina TaxID=2620311 RepID=UPI001CF3EB9F|nr:MULTISPECIES: phytoene desaturase family protein [unclassified Demequina]MCB2412631.1 phytoene desaturase [Demequina sp. TTPB684]UPU87917.1 phytoene desaturase family protein [Demequina sp. TMPB413]
MTAPHPPHIVIIGGGIGGLATAGLLARGGAAVTLLERHASVGGRAGQWVHDGYTWDTGPSWYLMREAFDQYFALMGTSSDEQLDLIDLDPRYRVFFEDDDAAGAGEVLDVVADPDANYARFNEMSPGDGDAMREYARESKELYTLALQRFLYTTFERVDKVPNATVLTRLPMLASLLTRSLGSKVAGKVRDERLRKILGFHAVFLGSSPSRAPSLFSLMSHLDLTDGVRYPREGMYQVIRAIEALAVTHGAHIRTGTNVTRIVVGDDGLATGVELEGGEVIDADAVVSGADMHHTETALLEPQHQWQPERRWAKRQPGVSALLVYAGVRGEVPQLAHHSLFFSRDWEANFDAIVGGGELKPPFPASVYVSRVTATNPDAAPTGHENLYMLVPFPADPELGATPASRAQLEEYAWRYLDQVAAWASIPDLRERTTLYRITAPSDFATELSAWRGTALGLEHTVRQSAVFRPGNVSRKVPNLMYVGASTVPGIGMPICLISAELVAKRLLGATTVSPLPTPAPPGFLARSRKRGVLGDIARRAAAPGSPGAQADDAGAAATSERA